MNSIVHRAYKQEKWKEGESNCSKDFPFAIGITFGHVLSIIRPLMESSSAFAVYKYSWACHVSMRGRPEEEEKPTSGAGQQHLICMPGEGENQFGIPPR